MSFPHPVSHLAHIQYIHPEGLKQLKICIQLIKHEARLYFESGTISRFFIFNAAPTWAEMNLNVLESPSIMSKELLYWHSKDRVAEAEIWGDPEAKGHSDRITEFLSFDMGGEREAKREGERKTCQPALQKDMSKIQSLEQRNGCRENGAIGL